MFICPYCNNKQDNGNPHAKFCPACGHKIERCSTCGAILLRKVRFCPHDGTPVPPEVYDNLPDAAPAPQAEIPIPVPYSGAWPEPPVSQTEIPTPVPSEPDYGPQKPYTGSTTPIRQGGSNPATIILGIVAGVLLIAVIFFGVYILKPEVLPFGKGQTETSAADDAAEKLVSDIIGDGSEAIVPPLTVTPSETQIAELPATIDQPSTQPDAIEPVQEEPITIEPDPEPEFGSEPLCPWISTRKMTDSLYWELYDQYRYTEFPGGRNLAQMLINDLHALNGYTFSNPELQAYYGDQEWYQEIQRTMSMTTDKDTVYYRMNSTEQANVTFLSNYR